VVMDNDSGRIAIPDIIESHSQLQTMRPQLWLHCVFGNIKNRYVAAQIAVTNLY